MAVITIYDTSELDKRQLTAGLEETDHRYNFVEDKISLDNLDPESEIISVFVSSTVTREMIERLPKLTLICCRSTGYNNIDLEAAKERNITVVNVPTYGDVTVAEYAFTMLLALTRKLEEVLEAENEPFEAKELSGHDLSGKTFGVIGTGRIGQKALKIANGFSMRTIACDAFPNDALTSELNFAYVSLEELLAQADIISLHVPYNPDTHHLMNRQRLESMKSGAILINTARGALVDTRALVELLDNGHLGGAALDVVEGEKLLDYEEQMALIASGETEEDTLRHSVEISALKKMPNVIISPHNAYNTIEAIGRINGTTVRNIIGFYNGDIPNKVGVKQKLGKLILLRHTQSEWNASGTWTGLTDICLSEKGRKDCVPLGIKLKELGIDINVACHTELSRTKETLTGVCQVIGEDGLEVISESAFNERDYGTYTGKNKWSVKDELGEEEFNKLRRGWDVHIPDGETLKMVYERVVPAYNDKILPMLRTGKNVLIVAHGNSLRALIKHLESVPDDDIASVEMPLCKIIIYEVDPVTGLKKSVEIIETETTPNEPVTC